MAKSKLLWSVTLVVILCAMTGTSFAKPKKCGFSGDYSFYFWTPEFQVAGVGYFSVAVDPATSCRSGVVLPGGIINCYDTDGFEFESFIEGGSVFLETDGGERSYSRPTLPLVSLPLVPISAGSVGPAQRRSRQISR